LPIRPSVRLTSQAERMRARHHAASIGSCAKVSTRTAIDPIW